jgi:hypothetical protein
LFRSSFWSSCPSLKWGTWPIWPKFYSSKQLYPPTQEFDLDLSIDMYPISIHSINVTIQYISLNYLKTNKVLESSDFSIILLWKNQEKYCILWILYRRISTDLGSSLMNTTLWYWYCMEDECRIGMTVLVIIFSFMKMWFIQGKLLGKKLCVYCFRSLK